MTNEDYLARLKQGVNAWNQWRKANDGICLFLRGADLSGADLSGANLSEADLSEANLNRVDLSEVDLREAEISETKFTGVNLRGANLRGIDLRGADLSEADLSGADLSVADLSGANLSGANLGGANLSGASLIDAHLYKAILTGSCLWETQRADWSIKGAHCEYVFFDRNRMQPTHFDNGEFERLYAEKTRIVLHYEGGTNPIEVATLPALIQRLEESYGGCKLRLRSIQDDVGGAAVVTIVVDDLGQHDVKDLQAFATKKVQQLRQSLSDSEAVRLQLQAQLDLMTETILPRMLECKMSDTYNIKNAYGPVGPKSQILQQTIYNQNDLADIRNLVTAMGEQHAHLQQSITNENLSVLQQSLRNLQEQLTVQTPDHSIIQSSLQSLKTVFEGAAGAVVGSGWLELLRRLG